jgi:alpha-beta hydrolase superfamily lysophospholipase
MSFAATVNIDTSWQKTADGLSLYTMSSVPEKPRGVVVIAHGYAEHSGCYGPMIDAFFNRGFAVYAIDHRGHGRSPGKRASIRDIDTFVDDFHVLVERARAAHPGLPIFVFGHSMGGLIVVRYALRHQDGISGMIATSPALIVDQNFPAWQTRMLLLAARLFPELPFISGEDGVLSSNPAIEEEARSDPLWYHGRTRLGMAAALFHASKDACRRLGDIRLPFLGMHGTADRLTSPEGSQLLYRDARSEDKTLKLWPDDRHALFFDTHADEVLATTCDWLSDRA